MFVYLATLASTLASKISRLNSHVQYHCKPNKRMYESWSRLSALRHNIMKTLHAKSSHKNRIKNMTFNNWNKYTCRKKKFKSLKIFRACWNTWTIERKRQNTACCAEHSFVWKSKLKRPFGTLGCFGGIGGAQMSTTYNSFRPMAINKNIIC